MGGKGVVGRGEWVGVDIRWGEIGWEEIEWERRLGGRGEWVGEENG